MRVKIAVKGFKLSDKALLVIGKHAKKLTLFLSQIKSNLPLLDIIIRKQKKRRLNSGINSVDVVYNIKSKFAFPKIKTPFFYDGTLKLILPKRSLIVHIKGNLIEEAIKAGFSRLIKELNNYQGKHHKGNSKYFDHRSIRKIEESKLRR